MLIALSFTIPLITTDMLVYYGAVNLCAHMEL
jgi:hypothetical protein